MKKLKFAIIGPYTDNTKDLIEEIKKRDHEVTVIKLKEISFNLSNKFKCFKDDYDIDNFDFYIFRAFDKNIIEAQVLAEKLVRERKLIIDETIGQNFIPGKIFEASKLIEAGVNIPKTWQALSFDVYKKLLKEIIFPVIVKPVCGQKGEGVEKINNKEEYLNFFKTKEKGYLIQEYLPIKSDFRVMVVGDKVIGAIERFVIKGDFRSNTSLGAKVAKAKTDEEMINTALSASQALQFETAGVDMTKFKGKYYVLEVNHTPQWQNVKKFNKINPAKHIIDYAIEKYEKNKKV